VQKIRQALEGDLVSFITDLLRRRAKHLKQTLFRAATHVDRFGLVDLELRKLLETLQNDGKAELDPEEDDELDSVNSVRENVQHWLERAEQQVVNDVRVQCIARSTVTGATV